MKAVVTRVKIAQRENTDLKSVYDYADFEFVGTVESVWPKITKTIKVAANQAATPPGAPTYPTGVPQNLPTMAGLPPAAAPSFPAAPPAGFPPAAAAPAPGFPSSAAPVAPGFPGAAPAPSAAPGFPGASAPAAPGFPGAAAPAAAPAAAAPAPSFQDFAAQAKAKLVQDFNALPEQVRPVVLNVLGVTKIEDVPNEKLIQATQAVNSAKGFSPAPVGAGTGGNPF